MATFLPGHGPARHLTADDPSPGCVPYLSPRDLVDATGDHGAVGRTPMQALRGGEPFVTAWQVGWLAAALVIFVIAI